MKTYSRYSDQSHISRIIQNFFKIRVISKMGLPMCEILTLDQVGNHFGIGFFKATPNLSIPEISWISHLF